jgi:ubiquitin-conjugating enzyme E2 D/E
VLLYIIGLLSEPVPEKPLVPEVASVFLADRALYTKTAEEWTRKHASAAGGQ